MDISSDKDIAIHPMTNYTKTSAAYFYKTARFSQDLSPVFNKYYVCSPLYSPSMEMGDISAQCDTGDNILGEAQIYHNNGHNGYHTISFNV